ncbi:GntR family transcriptional regulator [Paenibacillus arenilitoris]|uniref:GntR family transcriptional regulator n=1 Tax=Paenibacillus arenilitoris TaxID=2772299 RepID=A0A927CQ18_9BACL|nr:GntR family transcriptional regulator [Paenibacillus arenilitoris]MBD2872069.1 GntR family transcriptional regulator [Paenibacillus arenilitoris]
MSKSEATLPKYRQVKDYVLLQIENNELGEDGRIPSESEFSKLLDVSSITVRKALTELVNEGVIYRVRGRGSFVSNRASMPADKAPHYVTLIISGKDMNDSSYMQIIKGIQSYLSQQDCKLIIEFVENDFEQERELVLKLTLTETRGLLIYSADPDAAKAYLNELRKKRMPFVMLDRSPPGYPADSVTCNNHDGAYEAVQYLIAQGYTRIGFAAYDFHLSTEADRYNGYRHALSDAGLAPSPDIMFLRKALDYSEMASLIRRGELTALFCANDRRALEAIDRLSMLGVRIPDQLSVMGFDDFEGSKFAKVPLSTVKQYFENLGYEGAKLLFDSGKDDIPLGYKKILLSTDLVIRDSVREK